MSLDNFNQLEQKINRALEMIGRLKTEKSGLQDANQQLEMQNKHLQSEIERLKNENDEIRSQLERSSSMNSEVEDQLKDKIDSYIGKIDDILGSDV